MKTIVLFSGGMDSCVALAHYVQAYGADQVMALTIMYGQRHVKELEAASKICQHYGVEHRIIELPKGLLEGSILTGDGEVPRVDYKDIKGISPLYVPFRNGLFLSIATAVAIREGYDMIAIAVHYNDSAVNVYPDTSGEFCKSMDAAIYLGSGNKVTLSTPFIGITKLGIARRGYALDAPMELSWSCYVGEEEPCNECPTCRDRNNALEEAKRCI